MSSVRIKNITKQFGKTEVLKDINLDIAEGEFISLVGPSGCGKSTLLRIIAGLEQQNGGHIVINDKNVNNVRPSDRNLAMVFQSYALYPHLTVSDNISVPLRMRRLNNIQRIPLLKWLIPSTWKTENKIREDVEKVAEQLEMKHLLERKPGELSGGQRQRVAVGRAIVREPVAFLMDEPLSNLDASLRVHMRAEIADLHRQLQTTFIYVTHDQAEALTMSDRIAVMMGGEIIQVDSPDEIYRNPKDKRVAEFIGSPKINILSGDADANGKVILSNSYELRRNLKKTNEKVHVGLRPEHLQIGYQPPNGRHFPVVVKHKENLGSDFFVHADLKDSNDRIIIRTEPEIAQTLSFDSNAHVWSLREQALVFGIDNQRIYFEGD